MINGLRVALSISRSLLLTIKKTSTQDFRLGYQSCTKGHMHSDSPTNDVKPVATTAMLIQAKAVVSAEDHPWYDLIRGEVERLLARSNQDK